MANRSLNDRVEFLEQKMGELQTLPDRMTAVESQILQLRDEIRTEFSATRDRFADLERRMAAGDEETRRYKRVLHEEVLARISLLQESGRHKKR